MTKSFEEAILSDVVKQVMTPEKMKAMADRLGPQIEKKLESSLMSAFNRYIEDIDLYELFYNNDELDKHLKNVLRVALGMPEPTSKKKARR